MLTSEQLFDKWFVRPLEILKETYGADAGFVALGISCPLYERYVMAVYKDSPYAEVQLKCSAQDKGDKNLNRIWKALMIDFEVDEKTAKAFWDIIRNGLLHGGMPKGESALPKYYLAAKLPKPIQMRECEGEDGLGVNHWLFADRVVALWRENIERIESSKAFPWMNIGVLPKGLIP
jgi:hypothetical protein